MGHWRVTAQRELFPIAGPTTSLPSQVTQQLLLLLEQLLTEAATCEAAATERTDEQQDHA